MPHGMPYTARGPHVDRGLHPTDPIDRGAGERAYTPTYPQSEAPTAPLKREISDDLRGPGGVERWVLK